MIIYYADDRDVDNIIYENQKSPFYFFSMSMFAIFLIEKVTKSLQKT